MTYVQARINASRLMRKECLGLARTAHERRERELSSQFVTLARRFHRNAFALKRLQQ